MFKVMFRLVNTFVIAAAALISSFINVNWLQPVGAFSSRGTRFVTTTRTVLEASYRYRRTAALHQCSRVVSESSSSSSNDDNEVHPSLARIDAFTSQINEITIPPHKRVRAYCLSDLHADGTNTNWKWIQKNCFPPTSSGGDAAASSKDTFNIIIVPGDMANTLPSLKRVFRFLAVNWDAVCYCVGNHEAWVNENNEETNEDEDTYAMNFRDSVDELVATLEAAKREDNIYVGPLCIKHHSAGSDSSISANNNNKQNGNQSSSLWIVPLSSFYHSGFDVEPEITDPILHAAEKKRNFQSRWQDYRNMKWPTELTSHKEFVQGDDGRGGSLTLSTAFSDLNNNFLDHWENEKSADDDDSTTTTVISFSHYLPRIELCIEKRFLIHPSLSRVCGSNRLESDIRRLQPNLHLFGHTHIPIAMECDGIRYAQWPLGYPREAKLQCQTVASTGPMLVFDSSEISTTGGGGGGTGIPTTMDADLAHWSRHYKLFKRDPNNLELAPWVRQRLEKVGGGQATK